MRDDAFTERQFGGVVTPVGTEALSCIDRPRLAAHQALGEEHRVIDDRHDREQVSMADPVLGQACGGRCSAPRCGERSTPSDASS